MAYLPRMEPVKQWNAHVWSNDIWNKCFEYQPWTASIHDAFMENCMVVSNIHATRSHSSRVAVLEVVEKWGSNIFDFCLVWGRSPIWLIFFKWVGSTTNYIENIPYQAFSNRDPTRSPILRRHPPGAEVVVSSAKVMEFAEEKSPPKKCWIPPSLPNPPTNTWWGNVWKPSQEMFMED